MKKLFMPLTLIFFLLTTLGAYELDGKLGVTWTGYKTEKKAPVSGTFNDIKLDIKSSDNLSIFLKSALVTIDALSLESKNAMRNANIKLIFSLASAKIIKGTILDVDETNKTLNLEVTMNQISKVVPMSYEIQNSEIVAKGSIDILDYDLESSYMNFAKKCAPFHQNRSFSEVGIEFTIPYK